MDNTFAFCRRTVNATYIILNGEYSIVYDNEAPQTGVFKND